ncbi:glycosyltransferase family 32 protein [uncultured Muribaculum sp.]|uniref:glycosyltransferase family 32 protein n=1 Tax=uncultured Muribaculum sp. TaxID=1918613 RepID=UPI0027308217|nr:glycosyltransferase [uncultured Muribaculum sp.]
MDSIPKVIHYCWFGRNPLPESALKCIDSWKKYFPDYEIKEWNEDNFDVNSIPYTRDAYTAKKFAFVSDYARFKILYEHGGLYFDTDVEVIKSFDDILARGSFMGCELDATQGNAVNPGLGLGAPTGLNLYRMLIESYKHRDFLSSDGNYNLTTIVKYTTDLLVEEGFKAINKIQTIKDVTIYPKEYFNPLNDNTGRLDITSDTHSIHWYSKTWLNVSPFRMKLSRWAHRYIGYTLSRTLRIIFRIKST